MQVDESHLPTILRKKLPPNLERIKNGFYTPEDYDYPVHKYLQDCNILIEENGSEIVNFLKGKSILITGATGFLGKVLVEKLLRSCKDIEKIYLIIRSKKGKSVETRVKEYLDNWIFIKLSKIRPNFREKVVGINGDLEKYDLDLTKESRKLLTDKVNIIYHVGATVRFDAKLRPSVMINLNGTRQIIKIAKDCKKLNVLCHVSTAFSNCDKRNISEEFYEPFVNPIELLNLMEMLSDETLEKVTPGLVGNIPNTYVFTKQLAEDLLRREAIGIPTCIQRPAIVLPTAKEPLPVWTDTFMGIIGLIQSVCIGITHIMPAKANSIANFIPADYVINHCIAASYKTAKDKKTDEIRIYNCTSSENNSLKWKDIVGQMSRQGIKIGSTKALFKHFATETEYSFIFLILNFLLHYLPACIADWSLTLIGKTPVYVSLYNKMMKFISMVPFFVINEFTFDMTKTKQLWNSLNEKDKINFCFDMESMNWQDYFDIAVIASREFIVKEFLDNLDEGRAYYRKVTILSYIVLILTPVLSIYFLINTIFCFIPITIMIIYLYYLL